jgi:hypothetical protein
LALLFMHFGFLASKDFYIIFVSNLLATWWWLLKKCITHTYYYITSIRSTFCKRDDFFHIKHSLVVVQLRLQFYISLLSCSVHCQN